MRMSNVAMEKNPSIDKRQNYHYVLKAIGWMSERSKEAVLKTVEVQASGGSNPSPSVLGDIGAVGFNRLAESAVSHNRNGTRQ